MQTQTLKIEIPKGFVVDSFDEKKGELRFKEAPKKVTDRIKTVDDVLADHGIDREDFDRACEDLSEDEKAYRIIKMLAESLNEGWTPNWKDSNEYKYYPWFEMRGSSGFRFDGDVRWNSDSIVGSRLCFKTRELAVYAGQQFIEVYRSFMTI